MTARRAFTLVGLLVVLLITAVLVGLLMSFAGKAREAAARARCQGNLKQLVLGSHQYLDTHGHFPPGTVPNTALPPDQRLSLYLLIWPYDRWVPGYDRLVPSEPWDGDRNAAALADWHGRWHRCPARPDPGPTPGARMPTNYIGVAGLGADAATLPDADPRAGVFGYDRTTNREQVKDGLANTVLFVETTRDVGPWARGGPTTVRGIDPDDRPLTGPGRPFGGLHHLHRMYPWQTWRGGSNVGLADGSVRSLRDDADPAVLPALATVAGGEAGLPGW
jgi:hypothetical protein